ncbi:MAG: N-6 DNA methylase, partial [Negativicutes bacterium]|nr:N-6 DNA methylase [Negativicutes bacterium]
QMCIRDRSFGLRGSARLEAGYADYLRDVFKESAEYKLSYYVLFMQRGIELLAPGGKLGFIVPDSFLLGRYFSKIRKYILDNTRIDVLAHISSPVFKRATVGMSAICILSREENAAKREEAVIQVYNAQSVEGMEQAEPVSRYPQRYFASLPHYRFRLFFDLAAKNLVDKLEATGKPLSNFAKGHTGVRSLTRQADLIASAPGGATWKPGLVSGSQVYRYGIDYQGHWLNIDPGKLYKGGWQSEIIGQRKILVRQTGFSLTAAIDDQGYYHLNNIHSFVLCNDGVSLDYLLLLLNSRLMAFYYHVTSAEYGRAMAQTDIETLELLPVKVHPEINRQAPELVAAMTALTRRERKGEADAGYKAAALNEYLNQLVYRIYELCETEVEYIENYERKLVCQDNNRRRKQTQKQQS